MHNSWSCLLAVLICCGCVQALQDIRDVAVSNSIPKPGQPLYYLMADTGSTVGPNDELRRTNRSLWKWWEDVFGQNNCCNNNNNNNLLYNNNNNNLLYNNNLPPAFPPLVNNNCNGLQLQPLDPFKQMKLFKKLPDLWGTNNCNGQCGQRCTSPGYGGDSYGQPQPQPQPTPVEYNPAPAPPSGGYETPNPSYDGPGDGDAGYVAPAPAPPATTDPYPAPPAADYVAPAPAPAPAPASTYEPAAPASTYEPAAPAPESYSKVEEYALPAKSYGGAQAPQIVYQPIIYLSASAAGKGETETKLKLEDLGYESKTEAPAQAAYEAPPAPPTYEAPPPAPPTYEAPSAPVETPAYAPPPTAPAAPVAPCNTPTCGGYLPLLGVPFYSFPAQVPAPAPVYAAPPAPQPAPVYAAPPASAPAPNYSSPSCRTPIRLSLIDQPYRVAPELFREYNYRLALAEQNRL